jgi:predicted cation transporter
MRAFGHTSLLVNGEIKMDGGSIFMARSLRRSALVIIVLLLAVMVLSSGAMASRIILKDNFGNKDDGSVPSNKRWIVMDDNAGDSVLIYDGHLVCEGEGKAQTKMFLEFHSMELAVSVDVAIREMTGEPVEIAVESEFKEKGEKKIKAHVTVTYSQEDGWGVSWINTDGVNMTEHSGINTTSVDDWVRVEIEIADEDFHVNVTKLSDESEVWSYPGKTKLFKKENIAIIGTNGGVVAYDTFRLEDHQYHWQDHKDTNTTVVMFAIFFTVLFLPFFVRKVEHNLEVFLFSMGFIAVTANYFLMDIPDKVIEAAASSGDSHSLPPLWTMPLVIAALEDPLMITGAVLAAGLVFHYGREQFKTGIAKLIDKMSLKLFFAFVVIVLGMVASIITAIIAALLLVEVITVLQLDRKTETELTILTCFSIGLGAALTPVGEPLSTIVIVTKLQEEFFYLARNLGQYIIPSVIAFGIIAYFYAGRTHVTRDTLSEDKVEEDIKEVFVRGGKVYIFVMALVLLGTGFAPLIEWYIIKLDPMILYWVNTSSAILDNATLAAAEITKTMSQEQINAALMSLLFSGGMLIPGNIPNIISAGKLHITSKEWAMFGVPMGAIWLAIFFVILFILRI